MREARESDGSSDTVTVWVRLQMDVPSQPAGSRDGDPCSFDTNPWNQLVIRDRPNTILGAYQPTSGQLEHAAGTGAWRCEAVVQFEVPEAEHYLVQANGATPRRIDLDQLGPGAIPIAWEDAPSTVPAASPAADDRGVFIDGSSR